MRLYWAYCRSLGVFLFIAMAVLAHGLEPGRPFEEYGHRLWLPESSGLPQSVVRAVLQTRDGYLWLGTESGLTRFDGVQFSDVDALNPVSLKMGAIRALIEDREGVVWVGTNDGRVFFYKEGKFRPLFPPGSVSQAAVVHQIIQDHSGAIWVATEEGLFSYSNGRLRDFGPKDGLPSSRVQALAEDSQQRLWIGSAGGGLVYWKDGRFTPVSTKGLGDYITSLLADGEDLWVGTQEGLRRLRDNKVSAVSQDPHLLKEQISVLYMDREHYLWAATRGAGVHRISPRGEVMAYDKSQGLSSDEVTCILEDSEGNLWLGTFGNGLNQLRDAAFQRLSAVDGISPGFIRAVMQSPDGDLWITGHTGGLNRLHNGKVTIYGTQQGLSSNALRGLWIDPDGSVWVGTSGKGLNHLLKNGKVEVFTAAKDGLANDNIKAILRARDGTLWLGTDGGVSRFDHGKFTNYTVHEGLASASVWQILEGRDGALWIATNGGVSCLNDGKIRNFTRHEGLSSDLIRALYEDEDGIIWIGTRDRGLNRLENGNVTVYSQMNGLAYDVIYSIVEDNYHNVWMSSNQGIFRVSRKELNDFAQGRLRSVNSTSYGAVDGMPNESCSSMVQPSAWKGRDGRIYYPTTSGVAVVDPARLPAEVHGKPIIERVLVDRRTVAMGTGELILPPGKRELEIHYTALAFAAPEKVRFLYKLEGFDQDWVDAGARRVAYYTNLPPGSYRFCLMVQGRHTGDAGSMPLVRLHFLPYYHQTVWFWVVLVLALAGSIFGLVRLRIRRLKLQEQALVAIVDARTKELQAEISEHKKAEVKLSNANLAAESARQAAEAAQQAAEQANRAKSEFLANMSHEIRTPMNGILGMTELAMATNSVDERREYLGIVKSSADALLVIINDVLDYSKIEAGKIELDPVSFQLAAVVDETVKSISLQAQGKGLQLRFALESGLPEAMMGDPVRLRQVLLNLLGNAIKFTHQGEIHLAVTGEPGDSGKLRLHFALKDTGIGIPAEKQETIFQAFEQADTSTTRHYGGTGLGLAISSRIVRLMGGRMWVESEPGKGSTFHFTAQVTAVGKPVRSAQVAAGAEKVPAQPLAAAPELNQSFHILVAEDNAVNQKLAVAILNKLGHRPEVADNGQQAWEKWRTGDFDLILMDVQMPEMDGFEATAHIREEEKPAGRHTPIIALTAHAMIGDRERCLEAGMDDYVSKPVSRASLQDVITRTMEDARRQAGEGDPPVEIEAQILEAEGMAETAPQRG